VRWLLAFFVVCAGCVMTVPEDHSISADLAAETARCVVEMRAAVRPEPPAPPKPQPGEKCQDCDGTGRLPTDGRVVITCSSCRGTGKKLQSVLVNE
jgi:hypothetical protein